MAQKPEATVTPAEATPWEWARSRRKVFTSPVKDVLTGLVVGAAAGWYRCKAGDANWPIAVAVSAIAVVAALFLPQLETLFWLLIRKWVLFEEAQTEIARLRDEATAARAGQSSANSALRHQLGDLHYRYVRLEREFMDRSGSRELREVQTGLHNDALKVIDRQLGRDYWSQFKAAKAAPALVAPHFPADDYEALNLLHMIHGRAQWLDKVIEELRAGRIIVKAAPEGEDRAAAAPEPQRLTSTRRLVREAAEHVAGMPRPLGDSRAAAKVTFMVLEGIPNC